MSGGIALDFDEVLPEPAVAAKAQEVARIDPLPETPLSQAVAERTDAAVAAGNPFGLACRDLLDEESQGKAQAYARKLLTIIQRPDTLLVDPNRLDEFGGRAVAEINALVDQMLAQAGRSADIPEIVQITKALDAKIRAFTGKYSPDRMQGARTQYEELRTNVVGFFLQFRDLLRALITDAHNVQGFLDSMVATLEDQRAQLRLNVAMCNQLYGMNTKAIDKLVAVVAVMEYLRDEAEAQLVSLKGGTDAPAREKQASVAEFIELLDARIGEFKQRLFIARATGPQLRNIRAISAGLATKITLLVNLTIPVFKQTIVQWVYLQKAADAASAGEAVSAATNVALQGSASAAKALAEGPQDILDPGTIQVLADSMVTQAHAMAAAYEHGVHARTGLNATMSQGLALMATASDAKPEQVIGLVRQAQQPFTTPPAPELPEVVLDNASSILASGTLKAAA